MTSKVINLVGEYQRQGKTLTDSRQTLKVCDRKNLTPKKSKSFLILKSKENPKGIYISSLYPRGSGVFSLDYLGKKYDLMIKDEIAQITISVQL